MQNSGGTMLLIEKTENINRRTGVALLMVGIIRISNLLFVENRVLCTRLQTQRLNHLRAFTFSAIGRKLELIALKSGLPGKKLYIFYSLPRSCPKGQFLREASRSGHPLCGWSLTDEA
jgi:hypothetical protein